MPAQGETRCLLINIYQQMFHHFGDRNWWPAETPEEVVIGAILVQNVAWSNVEKAISALKDDEICSLAKCTEENRERIESCIRSTRFYKSKADKLIAFNTHLQLNHHGNLESLFRQSAESLRTELLGVYGIGPETADDIVLYAAHQPTFVIDAYTKRIFSRLGLLPESIPYADMREWFLRHLPQDVPFLNQYHALLDAVGHHYCFTRKPNCAACPLQSICFYNKETSPCGVVLSREEQSN